MKTKKKNKIKQSFNLYLNNVPVYVAGKLRIKNLKLPYLKSKHKYVPLKDHKKKWWLFCFTIKFKDNPCLKKQFALKKKMRRKPIWAIIAGAFIGFINGFWGGGGGMVCVPTLCSVFNLPQKSAHATAIFVMLPLSIVSFSMYALKGNLQFDNVWLVLIGFFVGGIIGANLLKKLNNLLLQVVFAILIMVAGARMLF